MDIKGHWEQIYTGKSPQETSWYAPRLQTSLSWISEALENSADAIIDVGAVNRRRPLPCLPLPIAFGTTELFSTLLRNLHSALRTYASFLRL